MGVSENIKHLRHERNWTQEQLAKKIGVSRATVTQWETGWSQPRMGAVQKLAGVFNVTIADVVNEINYAFVSLENEPLKLTDDERDLIRSYRKLDHTSRLAVKQLAVTLSPETASDTREGIA